MSIEGTHLGKQSSYPQHYDPSVLVAVPRRLNREQYNLYPETLPFVGFDVWHSYEFSFLLKNGLPVAGILKLVYPSSSDFLVESKSLKLYLNSFNMDQYGYSIKEGVEATTTIIKTDLQQLLNCIVDVTYFNHNSHSFPVEFDNYELLEELVNSNNITVSEYKEDQSILQAQKHDKEIIWGSHLLRSNCKITNQPDWGSIFISMKGDSIPTPESMLKYIVSLRNENHFHEEICEMVFQRLFQTFKPEQLMVSCLYTRRGGIDINPVRCINSSTFPAILIDPNVFDSPTFRR